MKKILSILFITLLPLLKAATVYAGCAPGETYFEVMVLDDGFFADDNTNVTVTAGAVTLYSGNPATDGSLVDVVLTNASGITYFVVFSGCIPEGVTVSVDYTDGFGDGSGVNPPVMGILGCEMFSGSQAAGDFSGNWYTATSPTDNDNIGLINPTPADNTCLPAAPTNTAWTVQTASADLATASNDLNLLPFPASYTLQPFCDVAGGAEVGTLSGLYQSSTEDFKVCANFTQPNTPNATGALIGLGTGSLELNSAVDVDNNGGGNDCGGGITNVEVFDAGGALVSTGVTNVTELTPGATYCMCITGYASNVDDTGPDGQPGTGDEGVTVADGTCVLDGLYGTIQPYVIPPLNCAGTYEGTMPTEACSGDALDFTFTNCDVGVANIDFNNDNIPDAAYDYDLYIYAPGGTPGEAPVGFLPVPTAIDGFPGGLSTDLLYMQSTYDYGQTCPASLIGSPINNQTCAPTVVTFFLAPYSYNLDNNGDSTYGAYPADGQEDCQPLRFDITIYPEALTVDVTNDGSTCGTPAVDLVAGNGTICATWTATDACGVNGDTFTATFDTADSDDAGTWDPSVFDNALAACPLPANETVTCAGCGCSGTYVGTMPTEACSGDALDFTFTNCDVGVANIDFNNDNIADAAYDYDLYIYAPGGTPGEAPVGFLPVPTAIDGFPGGISADLLYMQSTYDYGQTCPASLIGSPINNQTCAPTVVTFFLAPYSYNLDNNGDSTYGAYPADGQADCQPLRFDITVYPATLTVSVTNDGSSCGAPAVQLQAANGSVCESFTGIGTNPTDGAACTANDETLDYDFSATPTITALAAAPAACAVPNVLTGTLTCASCTTTCPSYDSVPSSPDIACADQPLYFTIPNTDCPGRIDFTISGNSGSSWGSEITWEVINTTTGATVAAGGPYTNGTGTAISVDVILDPVPVGNGTSYNLIVYDAFGDGFDADGFIEIIGSVNPVYISGNFGDETNSGFSVPIIVPDVDYSITTSAGTITGTVSSCADVVETLTFTNPSHCTTTTENVTWSLTCAATGAELSSGSQDITVYPSLPTAAEDLVGITWDNATCDYVVTPVECSDVYTITPDPATLQDPTASGTQTFTVTYNGIAGGPDCCATGGTTGPFTYTVPAPSTSAVAVDSPFGGTNNSAYLTTGPAGNGGAAVSGSFTVTVAGYSYPSTCDPAGDDSYWVTIYVDGAVVSDVNWPAGASSTTTTLADISAAGVTFDENSVIEAHIYPNSFSSGGCVTTFIPGGPAGAAGEWTANVDITDVLFEFTELVALPADCDFTLDVDYTPCCPTVTTPAAATASTCSNASLSAAINAATAAVIMSNGTEGTEYNISWYADNNYSAQAPTIAPNNQTCAPITITYYAQAICSNGTIIGPAGTLTITVYPAQPTALVTNNTTCGQPTVQIRSANGTLCGTATAFGTAATAVCGAGSSSATSTGTYTAADVATIMGGMASCYAPVNYTGTSSCPNLGNPSPTATATAATCFGSSTGSINVAPDGFAAYNWGTAPGSGNDPRTGLPAGTYRVTVTDVNSCTATASATVTQPTALACPYTIAPIGCAGGTGGITVTASGGTPGYTYTWSTGATTSSVSGLAGGTYNYTVTDANNCTCSPAAPVNVVSPPPVALLVAPLNTNEGNTGSITPFYYNVDTWTVQGGTPPYSYTWSSTGYVRHAVVSSSVTPPQATIRVTYADNATWYCTVTDANGCQLQQVVVSNDMLNGTPNSGAILDIDAYYIKTASYNTATGAIKLCVSGSGCASPTYQWSGPATWLTPTPAAGVTGTSYGSGTAATGLCAAGAGNHTFNLNGLPYGWYSVTVTCDLNGDGTIAENETTEGWYWVPRSTTSSTGVRGKMDGSALLAVTPNPFSSVTAITFGTEQGGKTSVVVYGVDGRAIRTLFEGDMEATTTYTAEFDATNLPAGLYIVQLTTDKGEIQQTKLLLTK